MSKNLNIPMVTDLVATGDPRLKAKAQKSHSAHSHIDELNTRIDELETAIGQDTSGPIGRAHAIRAESTSSKKVKKTTKNNRSNNNSNKRINLSSKDKAL